jgi:NADPH-dependent curcumin reductase CurA
MRSTNRQWRLSRRPNGLVCPADFRLTESPIPEVADGEVLVRIDLLSCDPTQRGWMAYDTYLPAVPIGEVMRGIAGGEVVRSRNPNFPAGQRVQGIFGWQDYACIRPAQTTFMNAIPDGIPLENGMSVLGLTGMTAYFGLLDVGHAKAGETVLVSGAAGATGSVVGQIAKILGCRVVGIAGSAEKCRYLTDELGFDAAIDYKNENLLTRLRLTCPNGVDVFFDNVGGAALDAALGNLAMRGRIVICGAISTYNADAPAPGPKAYLRLITRRGRMEGFVVTDYMTRASEATVALAAWFAEGRIKDRVDIVQGFENAPAALARLFSGENRGKQLVRISE